MTQLADFGVYIHWPFCQKKCPYCDFNSHVRDTVDHDRFGAAIITELTTMADQFDMRGRTVHSVFWWRDTIADAARNRWPDLHGH
jgi:oxygen-independent coproporphyrinogen-3 oxidase